MSTDERLGPGVSRRRAKADPKPAAAPAPAPEKRKGPAQRFSQPHEMKAAREQQVLDRWSSVVGVVPELLPKQLPGMLREWGIEGMLRAVEEVAAQRRPRAPSRENFGVLVAIFRDWRAQARRK